MAYISTYLLFALTRFAGRDVRPTASAFLIALFLLFFIGFREWVGCDFFGYLQRFEQYRLYSFEEAITRSEPAFAALNYFLIVNDLDYMWLNFSAALFFVFGLYQFAKRHPTGLAIIYFAFPILIIQLAMSGLRQAIAVGILFLAWNAFQDRRRIAFALWVLLAGQFHASALIFLPLALIIGVTVSPMRIVLATVAFSPIVLLLLGDRAETYQARYLEGDIESAGAVFRVGIVALTAIVFELYRDRFQVLAPKSYHLMRAFSLFALALLPVMLVSTLIAHRLSYYLMSVQILMLSYAPMAIAGPRKSQARSIELIPLALYLAYMVVWLSYSRHARLCYAPYDSYLW